MLSETTKNTLDNLFSAFDKRLDEYEIAAKKQRFETGKSHFNLTFRRGFITKSMNCLSAKLTAAPMCFEAGIKAEPFEGDLRRFFPQGSTTSDTVTVNRAVYAMPLQQKHPIKHKYSGCCIFQYKLAHRIDLSEEFIQRRRRKPIHFKSNRRRFS